MNPAAMLLNEKTIKYILIGVGVLVLIIVAWVVYSRANKKIKTNLDNQALVDNANAEIDVTKVSVTNEQFNSLVSKLHVAMKGVGTDEDAIFAVFNSLDSRSDVLQLRKVFGVKDGKTLDTYLRAELSKGELAKVNEILSAKSINFYF